MKTKPEAKSRERSEHMPTPWIIENKSVNKEGQEGIRIGNPKLGIVFDMVYTGGFASEDPYGHAEFIVRAVNNFEVLLNLVKWVRDNIDATELRSRVKDFDDAIAQAEEKENE